MRKKQKKHTRHTYTTTKVEEQKAIWRMYSFIVLLSMIGAQAFLSVHLPETGFILVIGAILGVDVPALVRRFLKKA